MKKILLISAFIFTCLLLMPVNAISQWQNDVQINNDPVPSQTAENNGKSVIVKGDTVIVLWQTATQPTMRIYSKRSVNGGVTWQDSVNVDAAASYDCYSLAAAYSNNRCYTSYIRKESGIYYLKVAISTDYGATWGQKITVQGNDGFTKSTPSIAADSNNIHIMFTYTNSGTSRIMYRRSTDGGFNFDYSTSWMTTADAQIYPAIASSGVKLFLAYSEELNGNSDIKFMHSTNNGSMWQTAQNITNDTSDQTRPSVAVSGTNVYVVWTDYKYGDADIISKRSTTGGSTWLTESRLTSHSAAQYRPNVCANGTNVHIVWEDNRENNEIYYLAGINNGGSWQTISRLTNDAGTSKHASIAVIGPKLHVVWTDSRSGNDDIYYKRNPTGNAIGIEKISIEIPASFSLSQNYPNPFNPVTNIKFEIPLSGQKQASRVQIIVYDILGRSVVTLVNEQLQPGIYEVEWDGTNFSSGIYFYTLTTESYKETKKMNLLK